MTSNKFRVAVVGGGVCGLTCAIALLKEGVDVHVYEATAEFKEIGAGIGIGRNARHILKALGIWKDIITRTQLLQAAGVDGAQQVPVSVPVGDTRGWFKFVSGMPGHEVLVDWEATDGISQGMHRGAFLDALVHQVDPTLIHLHKRCTRIITTTEEVTLHFQDGTTAAADVVLGADGIRSAVRRFVTDTYDDAEDPYLKFSGSVCYRTLIPVKTAAAAGVTMKFKERPVCFVGEDKHVIVYTIQGGNMINVAAFVTDPDRAAGHYPLASRSGAQYVTMEDVLIPYQGWGSEITNLLSCAENPGKWEINVVYPALAPEKWVKGRVAILGDAAHAMLPHLGAGAGQGIEDAYLLAKLLGHPQTTLQNVAEVLRVYAAVRQPRAQKIWEGSRRTGDMLEGKAHGIQVAELQDMWNFVWNQPQDFEFRKATAILQKEGFFMKASL